MICEMRNTYLSICPTAHFSPCGESVCRPLGGWLGVVRVQRSYLSYCGAFLFTYLVSLRVVPCVSFFFRSVFDNIPLCLVFSL